MSQLQANARALQAKRNVIGGNLQCKQNDPPPAGAGNIVGGSREDQCRGL